MSFDPEKFELPFLLPRLTKFELETKEILKKCAKAHKYLGELKGECKSIPNTNILTETLSLREARKSSEIEDIFTTQEQLYQDIVREEILDRNSKEVLNYNKSIRHGFTKVSKDKVLSLNTIKELQVIIREKKEGFRIGSNKIINENSKDTVYQPPINIDYMHKLLDELEKYINTPELHDIDPLIKIAIIHYQFESIHPFGDGNGRVGRMINILYLILNDLLNTPILYLSRYIVSNKSQYYSGLQNIRENNNTKDEEKSWQVFIEYILDGIIDTAKKDLLMIQELSKLIQESKKLLRDEWKLDFYSQDLINHLFTHPYTRNSFVQKAMKISPPTAIRWLSILVEKGYLTAHTIGRDKYYINNMLFDLLTKND